MAVNRAVASHAGWLGSRAGENEVKKAWDEKPLLNLHRKTFHLGQLTRNSSSRSSTRATSGAPSWSPPTCLSTDERRQLPPQAQQGNRRIPTSRRSRGGIGRSANAVSTCSFNIPTPTNLLPSVITSGVHDHAAPVAQYIGAIDTGGRGHGVIPKTGCRRGSA